MVSTSKTFAGAVVGSLLGIGIVAGVLLSTGDGIALPSDQAAAWKAINNEVLPALNAEAEAIAAMVRLDAEVAASEALLAELKLATKAAKDAEKAARDAGKAARAKLAALASVIDRLPASLKSSGQLAAVEKLKPEPAAAVEVVP